MAVKRVPYVYEDCKTSFSCKTLTVIKVPIQSMYALGEVLYKMENSDKQYMYDNYT